MQQGTQLMDTFAGSAFSSSMSQIVRPMLDRIDRLRGILKGEPISLPMIVVIGDQSTGKSSVLEAISGIELPRGSGICTRVPLELRMKRSSEPSISISSQDSPERLITPDQVGPMVTQLTNKIAGQRKAVSDTPIILNVCHPACEDLTLVDLPGIVRVAQESLGQPKDIYDQIVRMIKHYIDKPEVCPFCFCEHVCVPPVPNNGICLCPECITLVVLPGAEDFARHEALRLAREVDPQLERTFGVITKCDMICSGTNVQEAFLGLDLKLGYVAIRARTPQEILDSVPLHDMLQIESEFFSASPLFAHWKPTEWGTQTLAARLASLQATHVRRFFPTLKKSLVERLHSLQAELDQLPVIPHGAVAQRQAASEQFRVLQAAYREIVDGTALIQSSDLLLLPEEGEAEEEDLTQPKFFRRFLYTQYRGFDMAQRQHLGKLLTAGYHEKVREALRKYDGTHLPTIFPPKVLMIAVRALLTRLSRLAEDLVHTAAEQTQRILHTLCHTHIRKDLQSIVWDRVHDYLDSLHAFAMSRLRTLTEEESEPFTLNHYFLDTLTKVQASIREHSRAKEDHVHGACRSGESADLESIRVNDDHMDLRFFVEQANAQLSNDARAATEMQLKIYCYWKVALKRICDRMPLMLHHAFCTVPLKEKKMCSSGESNPPQGTSFARAQDPWATTPCGLYSMLEACISETDLKHCFETEDVQCVLAQRARLEASMKRVHEALQELVIC
eukprot:gnl/Trimastix_PCT/4353.p1 GENE.gnl/Trimastix_PCT/4353~~gnl/Trimastix_PCT/4353.p1  ORF type:complete len:730 (+),score=168.81 gnl/Trimastix_PCT/4353:117-2306(+)